MPITLDTTAAPANRQLTIVYRATSSLVPDLRNARTHPRQQVAQIADSIERFGFTNPILADPDGNVIAGHGRLIAAKKLQLAQVPVITLSGLTDAERRALRLADNKIAQNSGWDLDVLRVELAELRSLPDLTFDLEITGFSGGEIDVLLADRIDPDDDVIPAVPATPRTQQGDIWQLGDHRIGCGDCRDAQFLRAVVGEGNSIDVAFLDPPYNGRDDRRDFQSLFG
jgi:ParB-like chromosome segregation protein Spo0J